MKSASADCLRRENRADWSRLSRMHATLSFIPIVLIWGEGVYNGPMEGTESKIFMIRECTAWKNIDIVPLILRCGCCLRQLV